MEWIEMAEKPLKQEDSFEVIAFHEKWIDEDFNPNGTRVGFIGGDGTFISARWSDYQDCYIEDDEIMPTHYMLIPKNPKQYSLTDKTFWIGVIYIVLLIDYLIEIVLKVYGF